jgi:uncharacterized membrane protein (Fun14 family)
MVNSDHIDTMSLDQTDNMGLIETIKNSVKPEVVANKFGIDKNLLIDIGVYGVIGFIVGFLLKKYSEYFISLVLLVVGLILLQQFDYVVIVFNNPKIQEALGLQEIPINGSYGNLLWEWTRSHVVSASSLVVGFLVGLKIG